MAINMSYCRFENTLKALRECHDAQPYNDEADDLSISEQRAWSRMKDLMACMLEEDGYTVDLPRTIEEDEQLVTYHIPKFEVTVERDTWNDGIVPETAQILANTCYTYHQDFGCGSESDLLDYITQHFEVNRDDLLLNSCGEDGRIDIQRLELGNWEKANEHHLSLWKENKLNLYLATYTGYLEIKTPGRFTTPIGGIECLRQN